MTLLTRYISKHVILGILLVLLVITALESFLEFVNELSDIGVGHYGLLLALIYVPMQLPMQIYQLFPLAGFLGGLIGLGWLASSNELTVMRAAGISVQQIGRSVIKAAIILIIGMMIIGEGIAPFLQEKSAAMKQHAMGKQAGVESLSSVWLRQQNQFINIGTVLSPTTIQDVNIFNFDANNRLSQVWYAKNATLKNDVWTAANAQETVFNNAALQQQHFSSEKLNLFFDPNVTYKAEEEATNVSIIAIAKSIFYGKKTGLVTGYYEYSFWQRLIAPITSIVMICLGIPFIFGSLRAAPMSTRLLVGVVVGFIFYMLNQMFGPFTLVYQFPPFLAAALPTLLFLLAYVLMLAFVL